MRKHIRFSRTFFVAATIIGSILIPVKFSAHSAFYLWVFCGTIITWIVAEYFTTHIFTPYKGNRVSLGFHLVTALLTCLIALAGAILWLAIQLPIPFEAIVLMNIIAMFFAVNGLVLMIDAILTLKYIFRSTNAAIVDTGAYALVRHPQHLSILMMVFGSFLVLSLPAALLACAGFCFWLRKAAQLEEHQFLNNPQTAEAYRAYAQSTPALVPTFRSLKKYFFLK